MISDQRKQHWENVYRKKRLEEVSWYQPVPAPSLSLFQKYLVPSGAAIMDAGGGDSLLVDHLLESGYTNICVLDISGEALVRAQARLGSKAAEVVWIEADVTTYSPERTFGIWHDRAVFHFLTRDEEISRYLKMVHAALSENGLFFVSTFSEEGPEKCSGLEVSRYSEPMLTERLQGLFTRDHCFGQTHSTPSGSGQAFRFCVFRKK